MKLKSFAISLSAESLKCTVHGGTGDAAGLGGLPNAPVRALARSAGERALEQSSNLLVVDTAGSAGPQLVVQSRQAVLDETLSPLADGDLGPAQAKGDLGVALTIGRPEYQCPVLPEHVAKCGNRPSFEAGSARP